MLNLYRDVFASLNSHDVKYLVIGGVAATLHGVPRSTWDLDLLIEATLENAEHRLAALLGAGLGTAALTTPQSVLGHEITIFRDFVRVDVQTLTPGIEFAQSWTRREVMKYQEQEFFVLCLDDLLAAKRASGRTIDLEDVRILEIRKSSKP